MPAKKLFYKEKLTKYTGPLIVSMQRPAPGGNVRSAHDDTETISRTSTLIADLSIFAAPTKLPGF